MRTIIQVYLSVTGYLTGQQFPEEKKMDEKTWLLDRPVCINIKDIKDYQPELMGNYEYLAASPLWIKIRLILFWIFWAALVAVIIISILIKLCIFSNTCLSSNTH